MDSSRLFATRTSAAAPPLRKRRSFWAVIATVMALLVAGLSAPAAFALSVTSAVFSGGTGTALVGGVSYAKGGTSLTLTVSTSSDTRCVKVSGAFDAVLTSSAARTSWVFTTSAASAEGLHAVTVAASAAHNDNEKNPNCNGNSVSTQASYTVDNTAPVVTGAVSPAPNAAGWNKTNATVTWTAVDAASGVNGVPTPASQTVTANGVSPVSSTATDRVTNTGTGSATVRVDKILPTITAAQTENANGTTTIPCTGSDATSGIAACVVDGTSTNSKTVGPNTTVTGTATDVAGNTATASSTSPDGDTTAPVLTGAPTTQPNAAGWYSGDVTIDWTATDLESGIPTQPGDTVITGEGTGLTSSQTVVNGGGLSTTATSPAVKIDRTAPTTGISGTSNTWVNGIVSVTLSADDNLSGIDHTEYSVNGGAVTRGSSFELSDEGEYRITYGSVDKAGNAEALHTVTVRIDKSAPTIGHSFEPSSYTDATWTKGDVEVIFSCADQGGSDVATCTAPVTVTAEGEHTVPGTATDNAGNSATDSAAVHIDKTAPAITATANGTKNAAGWYNKDVEVTYSATDDRSGVASVSPKTVLGEGANQSASGTATDAAGNDASAGVTGINVDKTAPQLTAVYSTDWSTDDVTVTWTCSDALSGPAGQPDASVVEGEGDNLSATANCSDVAGNSVTETVTGIRIDRVAPTTTASVPSAGADGWYDGAVEVSLSPTDALSGVASTSYTVDGGSPQAYTDPFSVEGDGVHTIAFWSTDAAGNVEVAGAPLVVQVDTTAPTTTVINPISPETGWFVTSGIPFAFDASDAVDGIVTSGIAATYYTIDGGDPQTYGDPFTEDLSTGTHTITYWSVDIAGNAEAEHGFQINVDTVAPTITGKASPEPNFFGWNNTSVDVTFTCADVGSGIRSGLAGCAGDTTLVNEGAGQTVKGDAVDVAGNTKSTTFGPVNIDKTRPTLTGVLPDANGAGWYKDDVRVKWVGVDALSGIDPDSQPDDSIITGEGADLGAGPVTVDDKACNTSEPASVSGVKIDRTAPVVTGHPTTTPNAANWYKSAVTVEFSCSDELSGVASCPDKKVLSANGADQSVTSDTAEDVAGNVSATTTVSGINIDGLAPTSTSNNTCKAVNEWCTGDTADVILTAGDQSELSGVKEIRYSVDGGPEQVASGNTVTVHVPLNGTGAGTVSYYAVDNAGNEETANTVSLKWDNIAPSVKHSLSAPANADGWHKAGVTVTFSAKDDDNGSGVDDATLTAPVAVTTETAGQNVVGTAKDRAGNEGTDSVTVKLDTTDPVITAAITAGNLTASGWYNGPVTVTFTCSDALSGVAVCPAPVKLTANGVNSAGGTATDVAGNTAAATLGGIRIDQEKPTLTEANVNVAGASYTVGSVPSATCTATDSFSGVKSCVVTVAGGTANGVGTFAYTAVATDNAGNTTTVTGTYKVTYRFDGFLQPINDTAHQVGVSTSIFKAGSTVPVKFQLKNASGAVMQALTAPVWITPVKGSATSAPVDESVYAGVSDSGSTFRYDASAQQYIYNWKSGNAGGNYWRIGVKLDDGQVYYVNIGLR